MLIFAFCGRSFRNGMKRQSLMMIFVAILHKGGEGTSIKLTDSERKMCVKAAMGPD